MKGVPYPPNRKGKINPNSEGNTDLKDGRSASAALQYSSPTKQMMDPAMTVDPMLGGVVAEDSAYLYKSPNKQTDKTEHEKKMEELLAQGFTPEEAEQMIKEGAVTGEVKPEKPKEKSPNKIYSKAKGKRTEY